MPQSVMMMLMVLTFDRNSFSCNLSILLFVLFLEFFNIDSLSYNPNRNRDLPPSDNEEAEDEEDDDNDEQEEDDEEGDEANEDEDDEPDENEKEEAEVSSQSEKMKSLNLKATSAECDHGFDEDF